MCVKERERGREKGREGKREEEGEGWRENGRERERERATLTRSPDGHSNGDGNVLYLLLQCVAVCCSVLQCVAHCVEVVTRIVMVMYEICCCSVLQCVAVCCTLCCSGHSNSDGNVWYLCVAVCCSVLMYGICCDESYLL